MHLACLWRIGPLKVAYCRPAGCAAVDDMRQSALAGETGDSNPPVFSIGWPLRAALRHEARPPLVKLIPFESSPFHPPIPTTTRHECSGRASDG